MFGFGKRKCKECGAALGDMEALRDRADDLMKSSALGSAEPMVDTCARCRAKLTKGTQSLAMNLHVIEARRAEAEAREPETPERKVAQIVESAPVPSQPAYQPGEGFKTISNIPDLPDGSMKFADVRDFGGLLRWLVTTKEGRNAIWVGFVLVVVFSVNMCSADNTTETIGDPVITEAPPSVEPPLDDAEPAPEPPAAPFPTTPARPANNPGSWATTFDYPSRALYEGHEGTTAFRVTVNAQGAVTDCTITQSSGHAELDAATCSTISKRARFEHAPVGSPERGYANRVTWRIPRD